MLRLLTAQQKEGCMPCFERTSLKLMHITFPRSFLVDESWCYCWHQNQTTIKAMLIWFFDVRGSFQCSFGNSFQWIRLLTRVCTWRLWEYCTTVCGKKKPNLWQMDNWFFHHDLPGNWFLHHDLHCSSEIFPLLFTWLAVTFFVSANEEGPERKAFC